MRSGLCKFWDGYEAGWLRGISKPFPTHHLPFFEFIVVMFDNISPEPRLMGFGSTFMYGASKKVFGFESFGN